MPAEDASRKRKRAVKDEDKSQKRSEIIEMARQLLEEHDFASLSMDALAARAKMAKGTLYLYFKSKEELCLAVHTSNYKLWFEALREYLDDGRALTPREYARWGADVLRKNTLFARMLPIVSTTLEKNVSKEVARAYRLLIAEELQKVSPILAKSLGLTSPQQAGQVMLVANALAVGLWPLAHPSPLMQEIISEEKLDVFRVDFFFMLEQSLEQVIAGFLALQKGGSSSSSGPAST